MKKIFHLHIRKTSGTVLFSSINKHYGAKAVLPYRSDLEVFGKVPDKADRTKEANSISAISGHFYRFAQEVDESFSKVTILRNPVGRIISAFNHMKNDRRDPLHLKIKDLSFDQAIDDPIFGSELWNGQTRALVAASGKNFETLDDSERISVALTALKDMALVGFQENLMPFYRDLEAQFGIKTDITKRVNSSITSKGASISDFWYISDKIISRNRLDVILYFEALKFGSFKV